MRRSSGHHIGTNFSEGRNCFFKQPLSSNFLTQSNPSREKGELEHDPQCSNKLLSTRAVTPLRNVCADIVSSRRVHLIAYSKLYTRKRPIKRWRMETHGSFAGVPTFQRKTTNPCAKIENPETVSTIHYSNTRYTIDVCNNVLFSVCTVAKVLRITR